MTPSDEQSYTSMMNSNYSNEDIEQAQQTIQQQIQQMTGKTQSGMDDIYTNLMHQMSCDSECQKRMNIDDLRKKWEDAKTSQRNAPQTTFETEKNYLIASYGEQGYDTAMFKRYTTLAIKAKEKANYAHVQVMKEIQSLISDYDNEVKSASKLNQLLKIKLIEHKKLTALVDDDISAVQTNDRRVVYEEWAKNWLGTVSKLLIFIYIIVSVVFLYKGPFKTTWKTVKAWITPLLLTMVLLFRYYIALGLVTLYNKIVWFLDNKSPKNVYA
jgi:hypothetical protein